tara:strand:- start:1423 stop:1989 length:567 start_codon:yes stop_codon:yes gene_type:complete
MREEIDKYWFPVGHFNEDQRDYFIEVLDKLQPKSVLEIGWASGRSCITILATSKPQKMLSVDIDLDYIEGARSHANSFKERYPNWDICEGDSTVLLTEEYMKKEFPNGVDFIFVDGGHDYKSAKLDCHNTYNHLNTGGVMVVDDFKSGPPNGCSIPDVERAVIDFARQHNLSFEEWNVGGKGFAIFKK